MKTVGLWLVALVGVATLLAQAVGASRHQFKGPVWLRNSIACRLALLIGGMGALLAGDILVGILWHLL